MPDSGVRRSLHEMVGVGRHASLEELKWAYEQAMTRATRSGDHKLALALSTAFDQLTATQRGAVYDKPVSSARSVGPGTSMASQWRASSAPMLLSGTASPRRRRKVSKRFIFYGLFLAVVLPLSVPGWLKDWTNQSQQQTVPPRIPAATTAATARQVPFDAPIAANGLVLILCQPVAGSPGLYTYAARGSIVSCPNGAFPQVVRPGTAG
jgi:hypothetical protein